MEKQRYEHHIALRQDRLCPFKVEISRMTDSGCNWHNNIEVLMVSEGRGRMQYGSEEFAMGPHDLAAVNSGDLHRVYSEEGVMLYCIIIDEKFCTDNGIEVDRICFERRFQDADTEALCVAVSACYSAYKEDPTPLNAARMRQTVLQLLIDLCEKHNVRSVSKGKERRSAEMYVKKTLEYLGDNYTKPISLETVANICGITKNHLAREFKRYTGKTVFTYVNILRCRNAELCLSGGMTVAEAGYESGFESVSYFSRTYKKLMGYAPSQKKGKTGRASVK